MSEVVVAGTGMVPIGRYEVDQSAAIVRVAAERALVDAGCTFADVDAVIMASAHPASRRGIGLAKELGLTGVALQHVNNASATGSAALHEAWLTIAAGAAELVLVVGYDAADRAQPVADLIASDGNIPPVALFAMMARRRMHEIGTTARHLALVAAKNWNYARTNPYAIRRAARPVTADEILAATVVADPLTSKMCTAWCEGAAAVVLASPAAAARLASPHPGVRLASSVLRSEVYEPGHIFVGAIVGPVSMTRETVAAALDRASIGPRDLDVVQVHDAFAIEEIVYYEAIGLTEPGESERLLEAGAFGPGSKERFGLPEFSTGGGLIGRGHPGGPTGLAAVHETVQRLRDGDRFGLVHMLGAGSMCAAQVFASE